QGDGSDEVKSLTEKIDEKIEEMLQQEPVDQIGIPSGFRKWDYAIGGGLRRSTVHIVGARPKCVNSKTTFVCSSKGLLSMEEIAQYKCDDYLLLNKDGGQSKPLWLKGFGVENTLIIKTKNGFEIEITND